MEKNTGGGPEKVYGASIDVPADGRATRENVAEDRPYLVQYHVYQDNSRQTDEDHFHYYPPNTQDDDGFGFDIDSTGVLTRR